MRASLARLRAGGTDCHDRAGIAVARQHSGEFAREIEGSVDVDRHDRRPAAILHVDELIDLDVGTALFRQFRIAQRHGAVELFGTVARGLPNAGIVNGDVDPAETAAGFSKGFSH